MMEALLSLNASVSNIQSFKRFTVSHFWLISLTAMHLCDLAILWWMKKCGVVSQRHMDRSLAKPHLEMQPNDASFILTLQVIFLQALEALNKRNAPGKDMIFSNGWVIAGNRQKLWRILLSTQETRWWCSQELCSSFWDEPSNLLWNQEKMKGLVSILN